jgi:hypothetical protein
VARRSEKRKVKNVKLFLLFAIMLSFFVSGCSETYPKEKIGESIVKICKDEYKIDVKAETIGKTVVIYLPLEDLMDFTFSIGQEASEKINDVILSVARVTLSTNENYNFYCVIAHDVRIPEIQIVIIKSVDDVKRLLLNDISRGEYSKRILIDLRLNPQSQKERSVKEVFKKMGLDDKWQEQVMNDFFRSEPMGLGDIGYWNNKFYIKDITKPEFLAEQMVSRVKIEFKEDKDLSENFTLKAAKGQYVAKTDKKYFKLEVLAELKWFKEAAGREMSDKIFRAVVNIAVHVMHSYDFTDFDYIQIYDQGSARSLVVTKDALEKVRTKKLKMEDLLKNAEQV